MRSVSSAKPSVSPLVEPPAIPPFPLPPGDNKENSEAVNEPVKAVRKLGDLKTSCQSPPRVFKNIGTRQFSLQNSHKTPLATFSNQKVDQRCEIFATYAPGHARPGAFAILTSFQRLMLRDDVIELDKCHQLNLTSNGLVQLPCAARSSFFSKLRISITFDFGRKGRMNEILEGVTAKESRQELLQKIRSFTLKEVL